MQIEENDIEQEEEIFNINEVLTTLSSSIENITNEKNIELIFDMNATIPRMLRGDSEALSQLLNKMFTFVLQNTDRDEIVLSLSAPEDFLFEEHLSFKIKNTHIAKEKILAFLETNLSKDLEILHAELVEDMENDSSISLSIPFKNFELGFRRHYRLPDKRALNKKVLLLCTNDKTAQSIKKMFEYFNYDVSAGMEESKKKGYTLLSYDLLIISEKIFTEKNQQAILKAQESSALKYVLLHEAHDADTDEENANYARFVKPVTQEKVFDLIISLF